MRIQVLSDTVGVDATEIQTLEPAQRMAIQQMLAGAGGLRAPFCWLCDDVMAGFTWLW